MGALALALAITVSAARGQDAGDLAWRAGDLAAARRIYAERLAADSADDVALHRMALMEAWEGRYDASLRLFERLLALGPNPEAEVHRARVVAWRGRPADAARLLDALLAREPGYIPAVEARAEFLAWAGDHAEAVTSYEALAAILPENRAVRGARARILADAARLDESIALYDSLVRSDPTDRGASLGLGRTLGWAGRLDSAAAVYAALLARDPRDADAWAGLAQTQSWAGKLRQAERTLTRGLAVDSHHVGALVGLAQTLRWQGRDAAADAVLRRAEAIAPADPDVRTQRRWLDVVQRPRSAASVTHERDSDGSGIATLFVRAAVRVVPRLDVRAYAYTRWLDFGEAGTTFDQRVWGGTVEAVTQVEPGWTFAGSLGAGGSDVDAANAEVRWGGRVTAPGWWKVVATLAVTREPLDVTALLVRNDVTVLQGALDLRTAGGGWTIIGAFSLAEFRGTASNLRTAGALGATRPVAGGLSAGANVRAYGFSRDLSDGYFDPSSYLLVDAPLRWQQPLGRWTPAVEVAPGVQAFAGASAGAAVRVNGEIRYTVAPGREIVLAGGYSSLGLSLFAEGAGGYRYGFGSLTVTWGF
jgi:tetratricopeptide (TPR) repeat protein